MGGSAIVKPVPTYDNNVDTHKHLLGFEGIARSIQWYLTTVINSQYTGCPRRNVPDFGRVFLMLKYTDMTQNTYVQSSTVTEIMASEV